MEDRSPIQVLVRYAQIAGLLTTVGVLYVARDVLVPLFLGGLFSFALSPLVNRVKRLGCSNAVAVFASVSVVFLLLSAFLFALWSGALQVADQATELRAELSLKGNDLRSYMTSFQEKFAGKPASEIQSAATAPDSMDSMPADEQSSTAVRAPVAKAAEAEPFRYPDWLGGALLILGPIGNAGVIAVFALFALLYREDIRDRFTTIVARGNYVVTTQAINAASARIGKYLIAQLIINFFYGLLFTVGLLCIGQFLSHNHSFPYAVPLGMIAGLVRFLPYVGPVIGAVVPIFFALALFPGYAIAIGVSVLLLILELAFNNVVEPLLYGTSTGVSPVAIILAAVFWGWLWGPVGILLATPLTVCVVVLGEFVPRFRFLSRLLSDKSQIAPAVLVYQRLLIGDRYKLTDFLRGLIPQYQAREFIDLVMVPTIKLIKRDQLANGKSTGELLSLLESGTYEAGFAGMHPESNVESSEVAPDASRANVIGVATRGTEDLFVLKALQVAFAGTLSITFVSQQGSPAKVCSEIATSNPEFVLLMNVPPGGLNQTKYWCQELRAAGYSGTIVVASLGRFRDFDKRFVQLRQSGANWMTTTVDQTVKKILALAQENPTSSLTTN